MYTNTQAAWLLFLFTVKNIRLLHAALSDGCNEMYDSLFILRYNDSTFSGKHANMRQRE